MSRCDTRGDDKLKFDVAAPTGWSFTPGDTIIGNLVRRAHIVTSEAIVTLTLSSRIHSQLTPRNKEKQVSDDWHLLYPREEVIFRGPLHLPEGSNESLSWPFSLQIPTKPVDMLGKKRAQASSFLALNGDQTTHHPLPGTFTTLGRDSTLASECFIEYYLSAKLKYNFGSSQVCSATWKVDIRHPVEVVERSQLEQITHLSIEGKVQSQRLLLAMSDAKLSLKQKTQKLFGSSKVPKFYYQIDLTSPRIVKLGDAHNLPLVLHIALLEDKTSDSLRGTAQEARINWIRLSLVSYTHIIVTDCPPVGTVHRDRHRFSLNLHLEKVFDSLESPLILPLGHQNASINIGDMFQLVLHLTGLTSSGLRLHDPAPIYPDFVTYNIKHTHAIDWKISITIAGETQVFNQSVPLKVLKETKIREYPA
ncbi:hypothetical protein N7537_004863 [Penicillium hordei]|uniref:Arrestin-like N-terminal domain-containing protein n=1 Tax=Penicillium hordei TaxID=40994 RepID=A0AAD6ECA1_9EURO|nr:uncharacterized protein N7537_004863 [Penicillium hordei]KAJ5608244.1 hypothetical protein N7537_004863 [Penicillium hordei]